MVILEKAKTKIQTGCNASGTYYAWVKEYGLSVTAKSKQELFKKVRKALLHLSLINSNIKLY